MGEKKLAVNNKKKRILNISLAVIGIIVVGLLFNKILEQWSGFRAILDKISSAFAPIIVGAVIAFLMNPILVFFDRLFHTIFQERVISDKKKLFKVSRTLSVILTTIVFLGIITGIVWLVVPQLYDSIKQLVGNMDTYYSNLQTMVENINEKFQKLNIPEDQINKYMNNAYLKVQDMLNTKIMPNVDKIVVNIGSGVFSGLKFLYNFLIGIVASIYVMANKEYLASRGKKIIYAVFKVKNANTILDGLSEMNRIFGQFINGKILDSLIIGMIMFIVSTILNLPYAVLISVIVGVTNVIPFFGPIIGAVPCFFIVLIADPIKSLVLLIVILVLQQFDGNILGPKIIGDTTGLSSFWVLTAVIVGGGLFGFFGMLLGVPVFACCYMYINRTCTAKLQEKNLAFKTSEYEKIRRIDEETGEPIYITEEEDIRFKKKTPEQKLAERENKRKLKQKQHMLQYPSDLPDDEYVKSGTAHADDQSQDDDDSDDDPISIFDKFMHVMKSVASRADAEKLANNIVGSDAESDKEADSKDDAEEVGNGQAKPESDKKISGNQDK